jgi:hypothetical protein
MNVKTLEVEQPFAAERYQEYLKATNRTVEDEQCKRVYRAIARGNRVVNLCEAMRLAGTDHLYRPRLAIARVSNLRTTVDFTWWRKTPVFGDRWTAQRPWGDPEEGIFQGRIVLPEWTFPRNEHGSLGTTADKQNIREIHAAIPIIPPKLRPKHSQRYHILWEVDNWIAGSGSPEHSRDPLLLKHLSSWFFVIVAEWDLTEVERQVFRLSNRR